MSDGFAEAETLLVKSNFSVDEIADALSRLQTAGGVVLGGDIAADAMYWRDVIAHAEKLIDLAHERNPERHGVDLTELRTQLEIHSEKLFAGVISELERSGFVRSENQLARVTHHPSLPPELLPAAEKIRAVLAEKPLDPPDRKTFSEDRHGRQALRFLIEQGEIVELNNDIVLLRDAPEQMRNAVVEFLSDKGSATASQLRQKVGTSRRIIIPSLEYLD